MNPDTSRWRSSRDYAYIDDLAAPKLAWEWLRRNKRYQQDYVEVGQGAERGSPSTHSHQRWGLQFFRSTVAERPAGHHLLVPRG